MTWKPPLQVDTANIVTGAVTVPKLASVKRATRASRMAQVLLSESYSDPTAYTAINCTFDPDTTNTETAGLVSGAYTAQSVKVTPTAQTPSVTIAVTPGADLTDCWVYVRFYVWGGTGDTDPANISSLRLKLDDTSGSFTNWRDLLFYAQGQSKALAAGWYEMGAHMSTSTVGGGNGGDLSKVDTLRVTIGQSGASNTTAITLDEVRFVRPLDVGVLCLRFDDGWDEHFTMAKVLAQYGIPASFSMIQSKVENSVAGYATLAQLQQMDRMGHCIVNHGDSGYWVSGSMTDAERRADIANCAAYMRANNLGRGAAVFVQPGGLANIDWNTREARGAGDELVDVYSVSGTFQDWEHNFAQLTKSTLNMPGLGRRYLDANLAVDSATVTGDWAVLDTYVDRIVADRGIGVAVYHTIGFDGGGHDAALDASCQKIRDLVAAGKLIVTTMDSIPQLESYKTITKETLTLFSLNNADGTASVTIRTNNPGDTSRGRRQVNVRVNATPTDFGAVVAATGLAVATGTLIDTQTANGAMLVETDANGTIVMTVTQADADPAVYLMASMAGDRTVKSVAVTITGT